MKILAYSIREDELPALKEWKDLNPDVHVDYNSELLTEETAKKALGYDGIITFQQKPYTDETIKILNEQGIKFISFRNVGVDNINLDLLKTLNMKLTNVPVYSPNAIAEHATFLMGRLLRRVPEYDEKVAKRDLRWAPEIGREIRNQTIGVIGTGHIGRVLIQILKGFGAKIIAYDIFKNPELEKEGLYVDTLDEIYKNADIISLHTPATKDNIHMINDDTISKMKDNAIIINVSRGTLVDTAALIRGLDSGKISGAGLDVYENEVGIFNENWENKDFPDPVLDNLLNRKNVIITPHTAFYTQTAVKNMVQIALNSNVELIKGNTPNTTIL